MSARHRAGGCCGWRARCCAPAPWVNLAHCRGEIEGIEGRSRGDRTCALGKPGPTPRIEASVRMERSRPVVHGAVARAVGAVPIIVRRVGVVLCPIAVFRQGSFVTNTTRNENRPRAGSIPPWHSPRKNGSPFGLGRLDRENSRRGSGPCTPCPGCTGFWRCATAPYLWCPGTDWQTSSLEGSQSEKQAAAAQTVGMVVMEEATAAEEKEAQRAAGTAEAGVDGRRVGRSRSRRRRTASASAAGRSSAHRASRGSGTCTC